MSTQPDAPTRREHNCQTPDCPNDYVVITVDVESSETAFHCRGCWLAFTLAILQTMTEHGMIGEPGEVPVGDGAAAPG